MASAAGEEGEDALLLNPRTGLISEGVPGMSTCYPAGQSLSVECQLWETANMGMNNPMHKGMNWKMAVFSVGKMTQPIAIEPKRDTRGHLVLQERGIALELDKHKGEF